LSSNGFQQKHCSDPVTTGPSGTEGKLLLSYAGVSALLLGRTPLWSNNVNVCFQPNRRRAGELFAVLQDRAMVKRITPVWVIAFLLLTACGALCQSEPLSVSLIQRDASNSPEIHRQEMRTPQFLPDAPSVHPGKETERVYTFMDEAGSPLTVGAFRIKADIMGETELRLVTSGPQPTLTVPCKPVFNQEESSTLFGKFLYPLVLKQQLDYHPSPNGSFVGRVTYAASRIFVTRDESGKGKLNTAYFFGVLTSAAMQTAYRPYWARSSSETFNNFGSTIGSDAGMNVFHEFGPGIRHLLKGHTPKFVSRIEERIAAERNRTEVFSTIAK
jgi:hypothetical protein